MKVTIITLICFIFFAAITTSSAMAEEYRKECNKAVASYKNCHYVAEVGGFTISVFRQGEHVFEFATLPEKINDMGMAVDGILFVTTLEGSVFVINQSAEIEHVHRGLNNPSGLVIDRDGTVHVFTDDGLVALVHP